MESTTEDIETFPLVEDTSVSVEPDSDNVLPNAGPESGNVISDVNLADKSPLKTGNGSCHQLYDAEEMAGTQPSNKLEKEPEIAGSICLNPMFNKPEMGETRSLNQLEEKLGSPGNGLGIHLKSSLINGSCSPIMQTSPEHVGTQVTEPPEITGNGSCHNLEEAS